MFRIDAKISAEIDKIENRLKRTPYEQLAKLPVVKQSAHRVDGKDYTYYIHKEIFGEDLLCIIIKFIFSKTILFGTNMHVTGFAVSPAGELCELPEDVIYDHS